MTEGKKPKMCDWICTFCDDRILASKKPQFCIECGQKDAHEEVTGGETR